MVVTVTCPVAVLLNGVACVYAQGTFAYEHETIA